MPISVSCDCGKSVTAPSKLAGKQVKCPGCKKPLIIPAKKSSSPAGAQSLTASCTCGKSFRAPAKFAGKTVACPACKQPVKVPGGQKAKQKSPAAKVSDSAGDPGVGSLLDEVGFQRAGGAGRCPNCKNDLLEDAVICIDCGYNLETGRVLKSNVRGKSEAVEEDSGIAPDHVAAAQPGQRGGGSKVMLLLLLLLVLGAAVAFRMGYIPGLNG